MTALSVFTVIFCFGLYATVNCRSLQETDGDEEPFEPLCSRKCKETPGESQNGTSIKYPCSCSKSCAVFGDCCYDSPYKSAVREQHFDIICLSVVGRGRYQAVSSCPPDRRSDFCKSSLGHQRPVTSKVTNITYGNIFCASCNDDNENLVPWNVELRCLSENGKDVLTSSNHATKIIYRSNEFWKVNEKQQTKIMCKYYVHFENFTVLDSLELRPFTTRRKVSSCSESWRDLTVAKKCKSYEDPVYFDNTMYKNSHCAECNYLDLAYADCVPFYVKNMLQMELVDLGIVDFCKNRGSEACISSLFEYGRGRPSTFEKLTNVHDRECLPPKGEICCKGERFNRYLGKCRKITHG